MQTGCHKHTFEKQGEIQIQEINKTIKLTTSKNKYKQSALSSTSYYNYNSKTNYKHIF